MKRLVFTPLPHGVATATTEHMPFPGHRTCAEWGKFRHKLGREMTLDQRRRDAVKGSADLRKAIRKATG